MKTITKNILKLAALTIGYAIIAGSIFTAILAPSFLTIAAAIVLTFFSAYGLARLYPETINK